MAALPGPHSVQYLRVQSVASGNHLEYATLFEMHCRGYLYLESAERFGMQVGTVKSRLHRMRAVLQKDLRQPDGAGTN